MDAKMIDALSVHCFYFVLFSLSMTIRMIKAHIAAAGESSALAAARQRTIQAFDRVAVELDDELDYIVVPIRKLVGVQLGSALLAAVYAAER